MGVGRCPSVPGGRGGVRWRTRPDRVGRPDADGTGRAPEYPAPRDDETYCFARIGSTPRRAPPGSPALPVPLRHPGRSPAPSAARSTPGTPGRRPTRSPRNWGGEPVPRLDTSGHASLRSSVATIRLPTPAHRTLPRSAEHPVERGTRHRNGIPHRRARSLRGGCDRPAPERSARGMTLRSSRYCADLSGFAMLMRQGTPVTAPPRPTRGESAGSSPPQSAPGSACGWPTGERPGRRNRRPGRLRGAGPTTASDPTAPGSSPRRLSAPAVRLDPALRLDPGPPARPGPAVGSRSGGTGHSTPHRAAMPAITSSSPSA